MQGASTGLQTSKPVSRAWTFIDESANTAARLLDRWKYLLLLVSTAGYAVITCYAATRKLFWLDEIFTIYISRLPSLKLMWNSLVDGADFNPPLLYALTHLSETIFGPGHLRARVPEIAGFWIFCLCLFRFVSIRSFALSGFISMIFPLITTAYLYAFEARSHGVVLGFCGLALISWQALATAKNGRLLLALGLFASLAAALVTHSYAFLLFVPLVAGELARTIATRRTDWIAWLALIGSGPAILVSLPLLLTVRSQLGVGVILAPTVTRLLQSYDQLLGPARTFTFLVLALIFLDFLRLRGMPSGNPDSGSRIEGIPEHAFKLHEKVALVALLTIPIFSYVAARLSGAPMMDRYSLATVGGIAALLGMAAGRRAVTGVLVLATLIGLVACQFVNFVDSVDMKEPSSGLRISTSLPVFRARYNLMSPPEDSKLPIVLVDHVDFAPTFLYAPPEIAPRLVYLKDGETDFIPEGYARLQDCCRAVGKVAKLEEILTTTNTFLVYSPSSSYYKIKRFNETGGTISIKTITSDYVLLQVTYPPR